MSDTTRAPAAGAATDERRGGAEAGMEAEAAEVGACALQDCFDLLVDCVVGCSLTQPPQYSHRA